MELKMKALSPKIGAEIPVPSFATVGSAAMDLRACIDADVTMEDVIEIDVRGKRLKARRVAKHMDQTTGPHGRAIV